MKFGEELITELEEEIERMRAAQERRDERIRNWETDEEDCFISMRVEERAERLARDKIRLIKEDGGFGWFVEYATLDGKILNARWCECQSFVGFGKEWKLRVEMPDGKVIWTTADTRKGLARRGIKKVLAKRPAWYAFRSSDKGMLGVYTGEYALFPSSVNYATGEAAAKDPVEIKDYEEEQTKGEQTT